MEELGTSVWSTKHKFKAGTLPLQAYRKENTVPTDMQSEVEDEPDSVPVLEENLCH